MSLNIIVLAKQVPDTRNVGKDAMKEDGTINRSALPAIFNPEDLNALEQALKLKDENPGTTVTVLTMGPGRAAEIIREGMYRGADGGIVLSDRAFAGADTLATSYALATAVEVPTRAPRPPPAPPAGGKKAAATAAARPLTATPRRWVPRLPKNSTSRKSLTPRRSSKPKTAK